MFSTEAAPASADERLTVQEFAARWRLHEDTIRSYIDEGMAGVVQPRRVGHIRIVVARADRWMERREHRARPHTSAGSLTAQVGDLTINLVGEKGTP